MLAVSEAMSASDQSTETVRGYLLALEEGWRHVFDPADSFQAYAAMALCRSMRRYLESTAATERPL